MKKLDISYTLLAVLVLMLLGYAGVNFVIPYIKTPTPIAITPSLSTPVPATATPTELPSPTPTSTPTPSATLNACEEVWQNGSWYERESGYCYFENYWVPGFLVQRAINLRQPSVVWGNATSYSAGVMQRVAGLKDDDWGPYIGGVALNFCNDVGDTVWLRRGGYTEWEGPFLVVDCCRPVALYTNIVDHGVVVEIDHETRARWGASGMVVIVSKSGPTDDPAIELRSWFLTQDPFGDNP